LSPRQIHAKEWHINTYAHLQRHILRHENTPNGPWTPFTQHRNQTLWAAIILIGLLFSTLFSITIAIICNSCSLRPSLIFQFLLTFFLLPLSILRYFYFPSYSLTFPQFSFPFQCYLHVSFFFYIPSNTAADKWD
jgi:hypothetical protein